MTLEDVEKARQATANAVVGVAETKFKLEQVRKDRSLSPAHVSDAATAYRTAEAYMHKMLDAEIAVLINWAQNRLEQGVTAGP